MRRLCVSWDGRGESEGSHKEEKGQRDWGVEKSLKEKAVFPKVWKRSVTFGEGQVAECDWVVCEGTQPSMITPHVVQRETLLQQILWGFWPLFSSTALISPSPYKHHQLNDWTHLRVLGCFEYKLWEQKRITSALFCDLLQRQIGKGVPLPGIFHYWHFTWKKVSKLWILQSWSF